MNKFNIGDRVYCLGVKMIVVGLMGVSCYGKQLLKVGFGNSTIIRTSDEIKPIIQTQAILGCNHKVYHTETGLCAFCDKKVI